MTDKWIDSLSLPTTNVADEILQQSAREIFEMAHISWLHAVMPPSFNGTETAMATGMLKTHEVPLPPFSGTGADYLARQNDLIAQPLAKLVARLEAAAYNIACGPDVNGHELQAFKEIISCASQGCLRAGRKVHKVSDDFRLLCMATMIRNPTLFDKILSRSPTTLAKQFEELKQSVREISYSCRSGEAARATRACIKKAMRSSANRPPLRNGQAPTNG